MAGMGPSSTACRNTWRSLSSRMLGGARRLAVQETIRALGVETDNPVAHDLHSDAADPRRVRARAATVNLGQRQETPGLTGIVRLPRQTPQSRTIEIIPQQNPRCHGKPPCVCHLESDRSRFGNPPNESRIQGLGITTRLAQGYPRKLRVLNLTTQAAAMTATGKRAWARVAGKSNNG